MLTNSTFNRYKENAVVSDKSVIILQQERVNGECMNNNPPSQCYSRYILPPHWYFKPLRIECPMVTAACFKPHHFITNATYAVSKFCVVHPTITQNWKPLIMILHKYPSFTQTCTALLTTSLLTALNPRQSGKLKFLSMKRRF